VDRCGDAFEHRIFPWKRSSFDNLPFVWRALPWCKTLIFWSGDDGASGVTFLPRGIVLEAYACQSVMVVSIMARKVEA
jgi:hypothetical protein